MNSEHKTANNYFQQPTLYVILSAIAFDVYIGLWSFWDSVWDKL